jgi:hypothetical protein
MADCSFDQSTLKAIYQPSIFDEAPRNGRQEWLPLQTILEGYIDMIAQGKIVAVKKTDYKGPPDRQDPWIIQPYSKRVLERTLREFERLVDAVERRMPQTTRPKTYGLMSPSTLDDLKIPEGFARDFLLAARKPSFRFLAPGVRVLTSDEFMQQPFLAVSAEDIVNKRYHTSRDTETGEPTWVKPIVLFSGEKGVKALGSMFRWPFDNITAYPSGLYLTYCQRDGANVFEDGARFVLPFQLGASHFARLSDGSVIGEAVHEEGTETPLEVWPKHNELYQMGHNKYVIEHDVQLWKILANWGDMVETGRWKVDANGVSGGIGIFSKADTEAHWREYWIEPGW